MSTFAERFFIDQPVKTDDPSIYLTMDGMSLKLKWSAAFPLPAIGQRIYITMNGIGWATVKGYFLSGGGACEKPEFYGYVGVMTLAEKPPKWFRDQRKRWIKEHKSGERLHPQWVLDGIGCEFGAEIQLTKPRKPRVKKAAEGVKV